MLAIWLMFIYVVNSAVQSCARVMTVESSLKSLLFPGAESRVESRVIILESESSRVIAKVSRVISDSL